MSNETDREIADNVIATLTDGKDGVRDDDVMELARRLLARVEAQEVTGHNIAPKPDLLGYQPPREVFVVLSKAGVEFASEHKIMADDHANESAAELPEEGPYIVRRYVADIVNCGLSSPAPSPTSAAVAGERSELLTALEKAKDALYNGFEPDNQCKLYYELEALIARYNGAGEKDGGV